MEIAVLSISPAVLQAEIALGPYIRFLALCMSTSHTTLHRALEKMDIVYGSLCVVAVELAICRTY